MATARNRHSATSRPRLGEATCRQASQRSAAHIPPKRSAYAYAPRKSSPAAMAPAYAAKNATCSLRRCISVPLISAPLGIEARRQCQPEVQQLIAQPAHEEHVVERDRKLAEPVVRAHAGDAHCDVEQCPQRAGQRQQERAEKRGPQGPERHAHAKAEEGSHMARVWSRPPPPPRAGGGGRVGEEKTRRERREKQP